MRTAGNILWLLFCGGLGMGLVWVLLGTLFFITIVGIPWARAGFVIAGMAFAPFGKEAVSRRDLKGEKDVGTSGWGLLGNVIWFVLAGFWLAVGHAVSGLSLCLTIIGIPFGLQHFKLAGLALAPIGKVVVDKEAAEELRRRRATRLVDSYGRDKGPRDAPGPGPYAPEPPTAASPAVAAQHAPSALPAASPPAPGSDPAPSPVPESSPPPSPATPVSEVETDTLWLPGDAASAAPMAAAPPREEFLLSVIGGEFLGNRVPLSARPLVIGRSPSSANLVLSSRLVSRAHCQVHAVDGAVYVRCLKAVNGVLVNNKRMPANVTWQMGIGDTISLPDGSDFLVVKV